MVKSQILSGRSRRRRLLGAALALAVPAALAVSGGTLASGDLPARLDS